MLFDPVSSKLIYPENLGGGFQGFSLREKPGAQYVYQLVREDGTVAKGLSEGERHFIVFLYFYHMVMGSPSDEGRMKDKIVLIDDPVSSMDSSTLFTVASLVREILMRLSLIRLC